MLLELMSMIIIVHIRYIDRQLYALCHSKKYVPNFGFTVSMRILSSTNSITFPRFQGKNKGQNSDVDLSIFKDYITKKDVTWTISWNE